MRLMNKAEREALHKLYMRNHTESLTYLRFRRRATYNRWMDCWMVPWCGMWIGIESDGYTHS